MGTARRVYRIGELGLNQSQDLFFHPYAPTEFATFDIEPFESNHPGFEPSAQLQVLAVNDHDDGRGYLLRFTNKSVPNGNPRVYVNLIEFVETIT
jgi:hypothetical protein